MVFCPYLHLIVCQDVDAVYNVVNYIFPPNNPHRVPHFARQQDHPPFLLGLEEVLNVLPPIIDFVDAALCETFQFHYLLRLKAGVLILLQPLPCLTLGAHPVIWAWTFSAHGNIAKVPFKSNPIHAHASEIVTSTRGAAFV